MKIRTKIYLYIIGFVNLAFNSFSQQSKLSSLAYKDKYLVIPAFAGMEGTLMGSAIYRNQWQNLNGHPHGIDLSIHFPVYKWGAAMGLLIGQDELGLEHHSFIKPSFHKISKINEFLISTGVQAEFYWLNFESELARTPDGSYQGPDINHNDPGLTNQQGTNSFFDLGMSLYIIWHQYQFGLCIEKLLQSNHIDRPFPWKNQRSLKVLGSTEYKLNEFNLQAQIVVYSDFVQLQSDFFSGIDYNGNIFGGVHLRGYNGNSLESLGVSLGFRLSRNIQMAYCHEFYIGQIPVNYVSASQEIGLFYNFGKAFGLGKVPRIIHSPRYSD